MTVAAAVCERALNSEEIKPAAFTIVELCLQHPVSQLAAIFVM